MKFPGLLAKLFSHPLMSKDLLKITEQRRQDGEVRTEVVGGGVLASD